MKNPSGSAFQPGNTFGRGRPKGSRNKATIALQEMLDGHGEMITKKCEQLAMQGDATAMRLSMERLIPPRKEQPVTFKVPAGTGAAKITATLDAILRDLSRGKLTPAEALDIASILEGSRKAIQTEEFDARIRVLESGSVAAADSRIVSLDDPQGTPVESEEKSDE